MPIQRTPIIDITTGNIRDSWKGKAKPRKKEYYVWRTMKVPGFFAQKIEAYSPEEALRIAQHDSLAGEIHHQEVDYDNVTVDPHVTIRDVEEI